MNLVQSETQFNLSAAGSSETSVRYHHNNPVFLARLGFIGVDFGPVGKVAVDKQYAVQYDVAGYTTDRFNVFGGQGTFAYVAGTDGGQTGTGRADRIVNYRNTFLKVIEVGVQGQFRAAGNDTTTDGVGGSLQFKILPGVKVGGTYTRTNWSPSKQQIRGLGGNSDFMGVGTRVDWRMLELGFAYAHQHNGMSRIIRSRTHPAPVVLDAHGIEVYSPHRIGRFGLINGFTPKIRIR